MKAEESFRFIEEFPNYIIGDCGTIYSLLKRKPIISHDSKGYERVQLVTTKGLKMMLVHRLVAMAFLVKEEGKDFVDHIDGNKKNNNVLNLRWCTRLENNTYELCNEHQIESAISRNGKAVLQYDLDGNFIAEFRGQNEAGRLTGISGANISQVCNGKRTSAGGYLWTYKNV